MNKPSCPTPSNEVDRQARLDQYEILDTPPEESFDRLTRIASHIMGTPIALVSLIDRDRQWFKSRVGLEATETPRDIAFCAHAIMFPKPFIVRDAAMDERFSNNPLVTQEPRIRFYAGAPLTTRDGLNLGTLCAIDRMPRDPTKEQIDALTDLAQLTIDEFELRSAGKHALEEVAKRKRLDDLKSAFVADVNHELRTPLTSIIGSLGLISSGMMGEIPEKPKELLDIASRNSQQLLGLINDLLDMSKLESGVIEFDFRTVDIGQIISEAVENTRHYATEKTLTMKFVTQETPISVVSDKRRLAQVMNNLLSNAIKFSPNGGKIDVSLKASRSDIRVEVCDQGPGIPASEHNQIFGKFVQAKASDKLGVKGTGLGLSICKSIIESHGGKIGVESTEGSGSMFYFKLPLNHISP